MGTRPLVQMIELKDEKAVMFQVCEEEPERRAWNMMREWGAGNLTGYEARRYIGYAPMGHHPKGEEGDNHAYCACMLLHEAEWHSRDLKGAEISDMPGGIFLVGDVALNEFYEDGSVDIGLSMKKASQTIYEYMLEMGAMN